MQPNTGAGLFDDYSRTPLVELEKRQLFGAQGNCYLIRSGAVALFTTNDRGDAGAVGLYFEGDSLLIPKDGWIEALIYTSIEKIEPTHDLLINQFGEVCKNILDQRNLSMKGHVYKMLKRLWDHKIGGVNIIDLARIAGYSREITGKRIKELAIEGRVKRHPKSVFEVLR